MFKAFYDFTRLRYIHRLMNDRRFFISATNVELIPKTACFFSENLDVYIDTSDGVNDDLQMQEYCGRMLACINLSKGKKFVYFKCSYSPRWSKSMAELAEDNNGVVKPFFKFSFNDNFYRYLMPDLKNLRLKNERTATEFDVGIFADFKKVYSYPKPSVQDPRISWSDHRKFNIEGASPNTGTLTIRSRSSILNKIKDSGLSMLAKSVPYDEYISSSMQCKAVINPPGIGEYTSRMMDQSAIGNLIILRKNSYDQGASWKEYLPEVDFNDTDYHDQLASVLEEAKLWREKSRYYYDNFWTPKAVLDYFKYHVISEL